MKANFLNKVHRNWALILGLSIVMFFIACDAKAQRPKNRGQGVKKDSTTTDSLKSNNKPATGTTDTRVNAEVFENFNNQWLVAYKKYKNHDLSNDTYEKVKACVGLVDRKSIKKFNEQQIKEVYKAYKLLFTLSADINRDEDKTTYTDKLFDLFDAKDETSQKKLMQKVNAVEL
jgi:hypothetical protein